jgi:[phosphatase 2A protein]-leucine-carboxy methyltransferase
MAATKLPGSPKIFFKHFEFRMSENAIQATAIDAVSCKVYAVRNNYYSDAALLRLAPSQVDRKSPEIARGTWARVQATRNFVKKFLENSSEKVKIVVNCGAGFDTGYWWAQDSGLLDDNVWFDIDMEAVVRKKIRTLRMPQC